MKEFDSEKIMRMTKEEAISLLGPDNAAKVTEGLKNGTLTYSEFQKICLSSFPEPKQASLVRNVIFNQLSKAEGFNMFESNKQKQDSYSKMVNLQEKAQKGELTKEDLKQLCDNVFGENTELSTHIQKTFIQTGKVKQEDTEKNTTSSKPWELYEEEKNAIQAGTSEIVNNSAQNNQLINENKQIELEQ